MRKIVSIVSFHIGLTTVCLLMLTVKLAKRAVSYLQISYKEKSMKTLSLSNAIYHKLTMESEEYMQCERNGLTP